MHRLLPTLSFILSMFTVGQVCGQVNSYFENNPTWTIQSQCAVPYPCIETKNYMHYIQGDTILDGVEYMKLYTIGETSLLYMDNGPAGNCTGNETFYGPNYFIRSENRRIYFRDYNGIDAEFLLYDFNLELGDTLPDTYTSNFDEHVIVSGIDSIEVDGQYYERFELQNSGSEYLIEGIGSHRGLFSPIGAILECGYSLICYRRNDTTYFQPTTGLDCQLIVSVPHKEAKPSISVYPHPLTSNSTLSLGGIQGPVIVVIHDLSGKVVRQEHFTGHPIILERIGLQAGLYLLSVEQNGARLATTKLILGN